jgi:RNA polymerase sigma factor (sigma-70 family)
MELRKRLIIHLIHSGCPRDKAEDIAHDTILASLQAKPERECWAYYSTIARNKWISSIRKKRQESLPVGFDVAHPQKEIEDDRIPLLMSCLEQLPEVSRKALHQHFWLGLSREEAAATNSLSEAGWKNRLQRAKKQLRLALDKADK